MVTHDGRAKKASISKLEGNKAGESIPLMFGVLPRDNSPNIAVAIWGSDLSMVYGWVKVAWVPSGFLVFFVSRFSFGILAAVL